MKRKSSSSSFQIFLRLIRYTQQYRGRLVLSIFCTLMVTVLSVVSITMLLPVVDTIFNQTDRSSQVHELLRPIYRLIETYSGERPLFTLGIVSICFLIIVALNGIFRYMQAYFVNWIGNRVMLDLQQQLFRWVSNFHSAYFARSRVGSVVSYFTVDVQVVGLTVFNVLGRLLLDPCILLASFAALIYMNWQLTLIYTLVMPFIVWTIQWFARKNRRAGRRAQDIMARLGAFLQEHFSHIRLVQGYQMMEHQESRFTEETRGVYSANMSMVKARAASSPINELLGMIAVCCVLMLGGVFIFNGRMNPSEFVLFVVFLSKLYQPIKRLEKSVQDVQHGIAAAERLFLVLDTHASLPAAEHPIPFETFQSDICFENVSFSYDREQVLTCIDLQVRKGEIVALVGPSGAGKSTMVNLLPRFYDPVEGRITVDGRDLRDLDLETYRRAIASVHQDVLIFADSVRTNVTCGDPSYSDEDVEAALTAAYADTFVQQLPDGMHTVIGERGVGLSGGQCQRIAIARAFLRNAPILILDEATSSLDSESEQHVKHSLDRLMEGRTAFVIAHRLSTVLHADRIVVLDAGRIADIGTNRELLLRCGLYQKLYRLQFASEAVKDDSETLETMTDTVR